MGQPVDNLGRWRARTALLGGMLAASGCADLPAIDANVCGNGVLEPDNHEDCDDSSATDCGAPGTASPCRFTCARADEAASCPAGFGCGVDGVCRQASGGFELGAISLVADGSPELVAADFDQDGRVDIVTADADEVTVHYLGEGALPLGTFIVPSAGYESPTPPVVAQLTSDELPDLAVLQEGAMAVGRGRPDRTFVPTAYSSFVLGDAEHTRGLFLDAIPETTIDGFEIGRGDELLLLLDLAEQGGVTVVLTPLIDEPEGGLELGFQGRWLAQTSIVAGDLIGTLSPCAELVFARAEETTVRVFQTCRWDSTAGRWTWNAKKTQAADAWDFLAPTSAVTLAGGATIARNEVDGLPDAIRVADINGDGELDLLIAATGFVTQGAADVALPGSAYAAFGKGDGTFGPPACFPECPAGNAAGVLELDVPEVAGAFPLAVGDLNGDAAADFVFAAGVLLSDTHGSPQWSDFTYALQSFGTQWSSALVEDINRDGIADVVAADASEAELVFLRGAGGGALSPFPLPLAGQGAQLAAGDFDGDGLLDVAFGEKDAVQSSGTGSSQGEGAQDSLSVAFGNAHGALGDPVIMGNLGVVDWTAAGNLQLRNYLDGFDDLMVASRAEGSTSAGPSLAALEGSSSRRLLAPYFFAPNNSPQAEWAFALVTGQLDGDLDGHVDFAAFTLTLPPKEQCPWDADAKPAGGERLWLLPSVGEASVEPGTATNTFLTDLTAEPVWWQHALMISMDLGGEPGDEVVVLGTRALGAADGQPGALAVLRADPSDGSWALLGPAGGTPQVHPLEEAYHRLRGRGCTPPDQDTSPAGGDTTRAASQALADSVVQVVDVDADGLEDLVALGFEPGSPNPGALAGSPILALYLNDGSGWLDPARRIVIPLLDSHLVTGFALLQADADPVQEIALVTEEGALVCDLSLDAGGSPPTAAITAVRVLPPPSLAAGRAREVTSADFDGDGVDDLAVAHELAGGVHFYLGKAILP